MQAKQIVMALPMIALAAQSIQTSLIDPLIELRSPTILYYQDAGSKDWLATNRALNKLARMSSKEQIACQLSFIDKAYSLTANARASLGKLRGIPYQYHPVYDIGKLDLIRIALGKPVSLDSKRKLSFVEADPDAKLGLHRSLDVVPPAPFDPAHPSRILDEASFALARRLTLKGHYLVPTLRSAHEQGVMPYHSLEEWRASESL